MEDTRYTGETLRRRGLIFASAAVASMLSWRAGRVEGEAEMPCTSPLPPPLAPIFIRVSARPTCIINVAQIVRGQVGVRGAIALESNAGKNVASRFASWPGRSPVINCAQGSPTGANRGSNRGAPPYRSCACMRVCIPAFIR